MLLLFVRLQQQVATACCERLPGIEFKSSNADAPSPQTNSRNTNRVQIKRMFETTALPFSRYADRSCNYYRR